MKIFIEGIVGAGKTTVLEYLKSKLPQLTIKLEPVDEWVDPTDGVSMLTKWFGDNLRYTFPFEQLILETGREYALGSEFEMIDRSCTTAMAFIAMARADGLLTDAEVTILRARAEEVTAELDRAHPDWVRVYLWCDPAEAHRRKEERGTDCGDCQTVEWEAALHRHHLEWFAASSPPHRTIVLDVTEMSREEVGVAVLAIVTARQTSSL